MIPQTPFGPAAFHPIIRGGMTRSFGQPREMAIFAAWLVCRWRLQKAGRRSPASMAFQKRAGAERPDLTVQVFLRQAFNLFRSPPVQFASLRHHQFVLTGRNTDSPHASVTHFSATTLLRTADKPANERSGLFTVLARSFLRDHSLMVHAPQNFSLSPFAFRLTERQEKRIRFEKEFPRDALLSRTATFERGRIQRLASRSRLTLQTVCQQPLRRIQSSLTRFQSHARNWVVNAYSAVMALSPLHLAASANPNGGGKSLPSPLTMVVRGDIARDTAQADSRQLHFHPPSPAPMIHVRRDNSGTESITTLLQDVQKSINNIRVAAPAAPEVNLPQLTRQVYNHLERELRIEKERRGR